MGCAKGLNLIQRSLEFALHGPELETVALHCPASSRIEAAWVEPPRDRPIELAHAKIRKNIRDVRFDLSRPRHIGFARLLVPDPEPG